MKKIRNILLNIIGSFILALSVCMFITPFDITAGGATGISIIAGKMAGLDMSAVIFFINIICLPLAYFLVGKELMLGSVLASFVYPLALALCRRIPGIEKVCEDLIVASVMGGISGGLGLGLVIRSGGSTGGMDIPTIIISRYMRIPVSVTMYVIDAVIMLLQVPFVGFNKVFYGIMYAFLMAVTIDKVLLAGISKVQITIISKKYEQICKALLENDFGVTLAYVETGLEKNKQKAVITTVFSKELHKVEDIAQEIDPVSFQIVKKVTDVNGKGFTLAKEYKTMH